jgi:hypothetical protein
VEAAARELAVRCVGEERVQALARGAG